MATKRTGIGTITEQISKRTGKKTFRVVIYYKDKKGKVHRPSDSTSKTYRQAQRRGAQMLEDLEANDGKNLDYNIGNALQDHLPRTAQLKSSSTRESLNKLLRDENLCRIPLAELREADLHHYIDVAKKQKVSGVAAKAKDFHTLPLAKQLVSEGTVKRDVAALKNAVKTACLIEGIPYPWYDMKMALTAGDAREYLVTTKIVERLRDQCGYEYGQQPKGVRQHAFVMFIFSMETGMRQGEVAMLNNEMIRDDGRMAFLPTGETKNRKSRSVPLITRAREILSWLPERTDDETLFGITGEQCKNNFGRLVKAAGYESSRYGGFTFHDSRHAFCTNMVADGMNLFTLQHILGHSDPKQTARYHNPSDQMRLDQMDELEQRRKDRAKRMSNMTTTGRAAMEAERQAVIDGNSDVINELAA